MPSLSVTSWNVEHFRGESRRLTRVVEVLQAGPTDVVALYEVEAEEAYDGLTSGLPGYQWHITEGPQTQEIMVGVQGGLTAMFSQRLEFKSSTSVLRPGALVTVTKDGARFPLLFLHTKSLPDPRGFGIRTHQLEQAFALKKALDRKSRQLGDGPANFVFCGDLNSMGMDLSFSTFDIPATEEIARLARASAKRGMRLASKSHPATWYGAGTLPPSDLDQVVAAKHLVLSGTADAEVAVEGWPDEPTEAKRKRWIKNYSDHAVLRFEISA